MILTQPIFDAQVLQTELTPLKHNLDRTHELTSYLMLSRTEDILRAARPSAPGHSHPALTNGASSDTHAVASSSSSSSVEGATNGNGSALVHDGPLASSPLVAARSTRERLSPPATAAETHAQSQMRASNEIEWVRTNLMDRLQSFLPPSIMLPPRRLNTLLSQVREKGHNSVIRSVG